MQNRNVYFGDLHNHNAVGYAKGSLQRSFEIAREHLDFFAFTPHSQWHDMPTMPQDKHMVWVKGFQAHEKNSERSQQMTQDYNTPGQFVTFPGYEWHSSEYGDYCVIFPDDQSEFIVADPIEKMAEEVKARGAIMFPHHTAYAKGWRGVDWDNFPEEVCPVSEVYSEHGATMYDRGLHPMILHSMGGRTTKGTVYAALARGYRIGLIAGTDDHFGYPGAYGEGLAAVWADDLSRQSIWEAINARRTYAVTGDRIHLEFTLNDRPMGAEMASTSTREIACSVEAMGEIDSVEVLKNGRVVHREFVPTILPEDEYPGGPAKVRIQWGWGPWSSLDMADVCEWEGDIEVSDEALVNATPMFQSGPYVEQLRDRLTGVTENGLSFSSFTSREDAFMLDATKGVILQLDGNPDTKITLSGSEPADFAETYTLAELMGSSQTIFTGPFTSESILTHRLLIPKSYELDFTWTDEDADGDSADYYMIRVTQSNGQMAWSSPIWMEPD